MGIMSITHYRNACTTKTRSTTESNIDDKQGVSVVGSDDMICIQKQKEVQGNKSTTKKSKIIDVHNSAYDDVKPAFNMKIMTK